MGFRSAAAEDRFLQLRRRGRQKLAFFSANFGVWEQWELVAGEPKQAWNTQRMGLRNRQLQQVKTFAMQYCDFVTPEEKLCMRHV